MAPGAVFMPANSRRLTRMWLPVLGETSAGTGLESYDSANTGEDREMPDGSPNGQHPESSRKPRPLAGAWEALKSANLLILFVVLGLVVGGLAAFINTWSHNSGFGSSCAGALMTLATGLIISGALKLLLDSYQERKKLRDEQYELRERLLGEIRDVYLGVERARLMIRAHSSAKAYNHEMSHLIGCQATALRVKRSLDLRLEAEDANKSKDCFADIVGYLRALQNEFESNYASIEASQSPSDLTKLPVLHDFTRSGKWFRRKLVGPLAVLAARIVEKDIPELGNGAVKRAEEIPELDKVFDDSVEESASEILSACRNGIREGRTETRSGAAGSTQPFLPQVN
jgi:hypothetical protein